MRVSRERYPRLWAKLEQESPDLHERQQASLLKALADTCAVLGPEAVLIEVEAWPFLSNDLKAVWRTRVEDAAGQRHKSWEAG